MRKVAIIGSGTSGMFVAHALLKQGYEVTVYSDRTADDWLHKSAPTGTAYLYECNIMLPLETIMASARMAASKPASSP